MIGYLTFYLHTVRIGCRIRLLRGFVTLSLSVSSGLVYLYGNGLVVNLNWISLSLYLNIFDRSSVLTASTSIGI